jgi:predicted deacylase
MKLGGFCMGLSVAGLEVRRGSKVFSEVTIKALDGQAVLLPLYIINGEKAGPTLCITAGIHGTEYPGIEASLRLYYDIEPENLHGTIICSPMSNFESFQQRSMFVNPLDKKNLNDVFPGDPSGTITEVVANYLLQQLVKHSDYHIDLHSGDVIEDLIPFTFYHRSYNPEVDNQSLRLAKVYGLDYIAVSETEGPGTSDKGNFYAAASEMGVPSIQPEVGGLGLLREETVQLHYQGVMNVLVELGMVEGKIKAADKQIIFERFLRLRSSTAGIFYPAVSPGEQIDKGQLLGKIKDYRKDSTLEQFKSNAAGVVLWVIASPAVKKNDALMAIGLLN